MKGKKRAVGVAALLLAACLALIFLTGGGGGQEESTQAVMRDAVLHEDNHVALLGMEVNLSVASGLTVTGLLLLVAALIRIFAIPRFRYVPGRFQLVVEELVSFFRNLAKSNSPHRNGFLGAYIFGAGVYIFFGTLFELFGVQAMTTHGASIALPAPLSDINAAIAMGFLSYFVILSGGLTSNGLRGVGKSLKDFSLPISMSFRLFGALLSGLLVTELVYYSLALSFVLPVIVAVLFTLLHALIQTYVLTMLTSVFYGEVTEPHAPKSPKKAATAAAK